ncbi:MAG: FAD/NAD(P)-binding protein [Chloroflexaceae bacterium]
MIEWLIIGGGIHGVHLACVLLGKVGVAPERLRILDPHERLLARWETCTAATGMAFLRSTAVHHVALDPHDLWNYARRHGFGEHAFLGRYQRPALDLFCDHARAQIAAFGFDRLHVRGRASALQRTAAGWAVESGQGRLEARRILLAISVSEQPRWPAWAATLRAAGGPVWHLYEPGFQRERLPQAVSLAVIGGGISAAQVALALAHNAPGRVTLLMRHPLRIADFDSPPGWLGPKELRGFLAEPNLERRRAMIASARQPGSVPDNVARALRRAEQEGLLQVRRDQVQNARLRADGAVDLQLAGDVLQVGGVLLATGFEQHRPGGAWLDAAIATYALPLAPCGYPRVDRTLRWAPGLYVTGALAELELGPAARNIAGARHAGERLVTAAAL